MKATIVAALVLATASVYAGAQAAAPLVDIAITVSGNPTATVGYNAVFTITVSNPGTQPMGPADAVSIDQTLPAAFTQISGGGTGWSCHVINPSSAACLRTGSLPVGQSYPPLTMTAHANAPGMYQNCAHLSYLPSPGRPKEKALGNNESCFNFTVQPQVPVCLTTSTGPRFITGMATAPVQAQALSYAQNNWSYNSAQAGGSSYGNINHAMQTHINCSQASGTPFRAGQYTCTFTAQPCQ
jgi:uncharacterized repeat protein (TIGR01451 family)